MQHSMPLNRARASATARPAAPRRAALVCRAAVDVAQLRGAEQRIKEIITSKDANPIIVRLGWHDSGTYNKVGTAVCVCGAG